MGPRTCELLCDRAEIRATLARDPALNLYALGDLDPALWPATRWWGVWRDGVLVELVLLFAGLRIPVLMAFAQRSPEPLAALLEELAPVLPPRLHVHLDLASLPAAERCWALTPPARMHRMILRGRVAAPAPDPRQVALGPADEREVAGLLAEAYPGNFFEPEMLRGGDWLGWREGGHLRGVAGLHLRSPAEGVAALGNVAVLPALRGQGIGARLARALCARLQAEGIATVGLNVRADNAPALALYRGIGFETHREYAETFATRRESP